MHLATGGVTLVATGLKRKCGVCRHPMGRHRAAAGQQVNVVNTVSPTIVVEQAAAAMPGFAPPAMAYPQAMPTPVPVAAAPMPDRMQQLRELAELKQLGALTDDEFDAEKARIMQAEPVAAGAIPAAAPLGLPAGAPAAPMAGSPADPTPGWHADPFGRFEWREWDGASWTARVTGAAGEGFDPLS